MSLEGRDHFHVGRGSQQAPVLRPTGLQEIRGVLRLEMPQSFPSLFTVPSAPGFPPLWPQGLEPFSFPKAFVSSGQLGLGASFWVSLLITTIGPAGWASDILLRGSQGC